MEKIIKVLKNNPKIDEYQITEKSTSSIELFFIKEQLQMNRGKDVTHYNVTVFKNNEVDGKKFKGSAMTKISPLDTEEEISEKIENAVLAASFVNNQYYDLVKPVAEKAPEMKSAFKTGDPVESISKLVADLYSQDNQFSAFVNSCEFFIDKNHTRIVNSNGVDVEFDSYKGMIELIVEAEGETESIELFNTANFSDYDSEWIKEMAANQLKYASLRAKAVPMPKVENVPVILRTESAERLWEYYGFLCSASAKYEHLHNHQPGDKIQGEDIIGDKVTMIAKPYIPNSTRSSYYDAEGFLLKDQLLVEAGVMKKYLAPNRYAQYLNVEPTGTLRNFEIKPGSKTEMELKKPPYLEVFSFSDFQMDPMTGNFGGEFRLAIYNDGNKEIPVKLGAISSNLKSAQKEIYLSKETIQHDSYIAPKFIKIMEINIAGN